MGKRLVRGRPSFSSLPQTQREQEGGKCWQRFGVVGITHKRYAEPRPARYGSPLSESQSNGAFIGGDWHFDMTIVDLRSCRRSLSHLSLNAGLPGAQERRRARKRPLRPRVFAFLGRAGGTFGNSGIRGFGELALYSVVNTLVDPFDRPVDVFAVDHQRWRDADDSGVGLLAQQTLILERLTEPSRAPPAWSLSSMAIHRPRPRISLTCSDSTACRFSRK